MSEAKVKRKVRLIDCACGCEKPCGVDLLVKGYALIPPSPGYSEDADFPLEDAVEIPDALIKLAIARRSKQEGEFSGGNIQEGKRNATLASLAGVMRRQGMSFDEIFAALDQANERRCLPPLSTAEGKSPCRFPGMSRNRTRT